MNKDAVAAYYARNAERYHSLVEHSEERSEDLLEAGEQLAILLSGHRVLELACGTGVWTEMIAQGAASVVATDVNEEMLAVASELGEGLDNVTWRQADVFDLPADLEGEGDQPQHQTDRREDPRHQADERDPDEQNRQDAQHQRRHGQAVALRLDVTALIEVVLAHCPPAG